MSIFKANDIRGIYPSELNEEFAYKLGRAFVSFLKSKKVVVGRDARSSSPKLFKALAKGITDQGADVVDIGLCSTPMFYFACKNNEGIMVTASHNPKQYNGFKMCRKNASLIAENTGLKEVEKLINNTFRNEDKGKIIKKDILNDYIKFNLKFIKKVKNLKVVFDAGNGMGSYTIPKIFEKIKNVKLVKCNTDIDFSFPHGVKNPLKPESLKDLQERVLKEKADFGFATDGDGDRIIVVDEKGQIVTSDLLTAIIAKEILKKQKTTILYDIRCSKVVRETIQENNGKAVMCRVGHGFIKAQMRKEKAVFAGELSGHLFYKENSYAESVFISAAILMNILSYSDKPLSVLVKPLRKYYHSGEINFEVKDKDGMVSKAEDAYKNEALETSHLDGLLMRFNNWWFNLRKSNTEPLLRLNMEANDKATLEKRKKEILELLS